MKKLFALILAAALALSATSCVGQPGDKKADDAPTSTLMIYMIGSDLEAKSSAGTDDLKEIEESGVDSEQNNIIVYAGGSPQWHSELGDKEKNVVLTLGSDGFEKQESFARTSMGDPETLSAFLNYCVEKKPADRYALILWNHGSGPLMGYGKDMLSKGDSLTLTEMDEAMQNSPFAKDKRLDWVGFDACLMSSAELCCVWDNYADYLIASQEIEPFFGWKYDFLKSVGKSSNDELFGGLTDSYLNACLQYFEKKGYHDRDSTLACIDLSCADEMQKAVNDLFAAAAPDVDKLYDTLAAGRVGTRALGRASTGSEYDLVDLMDLAAKMESTYPEQAKALSNVLSRMIVKNSTNAEGLSGLSLYYPFYNKNYYENSWCQIYKDLNVFPEYLGYLSAYEKIWLKSDMTDDGKSVTPTMSGANQYTATLTAEQAKHYASAKYYVLRRAGGETYQKVFSSADVSFDKGTLTANFDGNVIYAHNDIDDYILPVTIEHDTVGSITNYSIPVILDDSEGGSFVGSAAGDDVSFLKSRFLIAADKSKGEIAVSALMPYDTEKSGSDLLGGKTEEIDVSDYTTYNFFSEDPRAIVRAENGVIKGVDEWVNSFSHDWQWLSIADGLSFDYAPLTGGDYALVFEICDTQGSLYCTEPVDIKVTGTSLREEKPKQPITVDSDGTFPLLLKEDDNAALYLDVATSALYGETLTLNIKSKNGKSFNCITNDVLCNGSISIFGKTLFRDPGQFKEEYDGNFGFDFGDARDSGAMKEISSLRFNATLSDYESKKTLWNDDIIQINFEKGKEYKLKNVDWKGDAETMLLDQPISPLFGAEVNAQTIAEDSEKRIELLCFGEHKDRMESVYRVTNLTDRMLYFTSNGMTIDGTYVPLSIYDHVVQPKCVSYIRLWKYMDNNSYSLKTLSISALHTLKVNFRFSQSWVTLWQGFGEDKWYDVAVAKQSAAPAQSIRGGKTLVEENGVKISLMEYVSDDRCWHLMVQNSRDEGIRFDFNNLIVNGKEYQTDFDKEYAPVKMDIDANRVGPRQNGVIGLYESSLRIEGDTDPVKNIKLSFIVYDFQGSKILFESDKAIELNAE